MEIVHLNLLKLRKFVNCKFQQSISRVDKEQSRISKIMFHRSNWNFCPSQSRTNN